MPKLPDVRHLISGFLKVDFQRQGFTLIELLIVIVIISILATTGFYFYRSASARARDAQRKQDLATIKRALAFYFSDHNRYPYLNPPLGFNDYCDDLGAYDVYTTVGPCADGFLPILLNEDDIKKMPTDPKLRNDPCVPKGSPNCFNYAYISDTNFGDKGKTYILHTRLEKNDDPDLQTHACYSECPECYCVKPE